MIEYKHVKEILFKLQPESAHNIGEFVLKGISKCRLLNNYLVQKNFIYDSVLNQEIFGKKFYNPIGLAAGFDKNGTMIESMMAMGFGHAEIGTVTPRAQVGNDKPRLFRYEEYESLQNAMGFNNNGSYDILQNVNKIFPNVLPFGVSIGKNKTTKDEESIKDYITLIKIFDAKCDYMAINISSPNTPNLRDLQNEEFIKTLFSTAKDLTNTPILLKISPDMDMENAINLCKIAIEEGASGIIATNTTNDYSLLPNPKDFGGISGRVLSDKSYEFFKAIAKETYDKTLLISVGGISDARDAYRRIKAGASLIQIYTAFVFQGPSMCRKYNNEIIELLHKDGFENISQAIGADYK